MAEEIFHALLVFAALCFFVWVVAGPKLKSEKRADREEPALTEETLEKYANVLAHETLRKFNCYSTLSRKQCDKLRERFRKEYRKELGLA